MPVQVNYPGVYIEEIPSGVRTITGVATSIAAFVGWAPQGPIDSAQLVLSWADYYRQYGGLDSRSLLGYAVSQFFLNGGQQAYIIRLVPSGTVPASTNLTATGGSLTITAENPGDWAKNYGILIKNQSGGTNRFRLQVAYNPSGAPTPAVVESFENLSFLSPDPQGRYVIDIIKAQSNYVTASVTGTPTAFSTDISAPQMLAGGTPGDVLTPSTNSATPGPFETALDVLGSTPGGVRLLDHVDLFNLLCVPGEIVGSTLSQLAQYCEGLIGPPGRQPS